MDNHKPSRLSIATLIVLIIQCFLLVLIFMRLDVAVVSGSSESRVKALRSDVPKTKIFFDSIFYDFGTISDNKKVQTTFRFTNQGNAPLMIYSAEGSCGCTVPEWPREAIAPGKSARIKVSFDPAGKAGEQAKAVTVTANTDPKESVLTVRALVVKPQ